MGKTIKMNTIKLEIKNIVKSNLQEKRNERFYELFMELHELEDKSLLGEQFMQTSVNLINEGYTMDEIENFLNEIENPISNITDKVKSDIKNYDFGKSFKESLYTSAKEYAFKWILDYLGVSKNLPNLSTSLAQFFASVEIKDLLKPFKNEAYCIQYLPNILNGILIVVVRYLGGSVVGTDRNNYEWGGAPSVMAGNMFGQIIKDSKMADSLAKPLCKIIH